jgi:ABC-2 type transport system permease protein
MTINFEVQALQTEFEKFDDGGKIMGLLQEGEFTSYFANRPAPINGQATLKSSKPTSMVVISDGDLIKNKVKPGRDGRPNPMPLGLNEFVNYKFDNKAFFDNVIAYLLGEGSVLEARKKNVELRLLDQAKIQVEKTKWQWFNIGLPLLLLGLFGIINGYIRKRKYAS